MIGSMQVNTEDEAIRKLNIDVGTYIKAGEASISNRHLEWNKIDENKKLYINISKENKDLEKDAKGGDAGYPGAAPIVVPITFAMNMATLSYLMSIFGSRNPMVPIQGSGGEEDTEAAMYMESILQYQLSYIQYFTHTYLWLQDMIDYGLGICVDRWKIETASVIKDANQMGVIGYFNKMSGNRMPPRRILVEETGYEGNEVEVVDPYCLIYDGRFPVSMFQKGDFFGYSSKISMLQLEALANEGAIINFDKIAPDSGTTSDNSKRNTAMTISDSGLLANKTATIYRMFVKLIPSNRGLGNSKKIEIFEIWRTKNEVIIYINKLQSVRQEFPSSIIEYNPDGHSLFNLGQHELLLGLQNHLNWLFNSHMESVRKVLNDWIIYDPSAINQADLLKPGSGKRIRLNESSYGRDVRSIISQLNIQDPTSGHLQRASAIIDFMQRVSAANDNMMGLPNFGRRTAAEVNNINAMAGGRMKLLAELAHNMGFVPQHRRFITNTQQYLSKTKAYRIIGKNPDPYNMAAFSKIAEVSPSMILGQLDVPPLDGVMPTNRIALAQTWKEIFVGITANPLLSQRFNVVGIFEYIANLLGAKDMSRFTFPQVPGQPLQMPGITPQPDDALEEDIRKGNTVALDELLGSGGRM